MPERPADYILDTKDATLLDLLDRLLDKGVMANGDLTLGVAGVDLIYVRLAALLCAADRVLPQAEGARRKRSRHRQPGRPFARNRR
jgi:hypothetical protein